MFHGCEETTSEPQPFDLLVSLGPIPAFFSPNESSVCLMTADLTSPLLHTMASQSGYVPTSTLTNLSTKTLIRALALNIVRSSSNLPSEFESRPEVTRQPLKTDRSQYASYDNASSGVEGRLPGKCRGSEQRSKPCMLTSIRSLLRTDHILRSRSQPTQFSRSHPRLFA